MAPPPGALEFTMKAIDGTPIEIALYFELNPAGYAVSVGELSAGNWIGGPSYGEFYEGDINPVLTAVNTMGFKAWIQANVCPWFTAAMKNTYGPRVIASPAPVPTPIATVITSDNFVSAGNAALAGFVLKDTDGDGLPELVAS